MRRLSKSLLFVFILAFAWSGPGSSVWAKTAKLPQAGGSKPPAARAQLPENPSPEQVDAFMAGISDEQARRLLADKLKEESAARRKALQETGSTAAAGGLPGMLNTVEAALSALGQRIGNVFSGAETAPTNWPQAWAALTGGKGIGQLFIDLVIIALIVVGGLGAERLLLQTTEGIRRHLLNAVPLGRLEKLGLILSRFLIDGLGIAAFILVTFFLFIVIYDRQDSGYLIGYVALIVTYYLRIILFAARIIFSPKTSGLRLVPMSDADAGLFFKWMRRITVAGAVIGFVSLVLKNAGISQDIFLLIYSSAGPVIAILLLWIIWDCRRRVAVAICPAEECSLEARDTIRARFAAKWHYLAAVYVIAIGGFWSFRMLAYGDVTILNLIYSLFLIPLCIGADQWIQKLLKFASGESREIIDLTPEDPSKAAAEGSDEAEAAAALPPIPETKRDIRHYVPLIRKSFRVVLVVLVFFVILRMWGVDLAVGRILTRSVLSIFLILILGLVAWEFIKARIDQKLKEEMPLQSDEAEEGGAGGSRSATLLMLLRKFILAVLFVIVALIILSSLGLDIAPLIAGAGVVGLAIGFGSQTLVKDIISGIFFLVDDAFRVGDYVEAGSAKGMVEHISLRSIKLRHPRGMVYTVPFGDLKTVTNFSRDYIITKLDIRVRFDADLDKVRKIVKKINKDIMKDDAYQRVMLSDIKSQGVREMDDSAMIVRVKFKTIPGEQFVLRREIYQRIQKAFQESGIEFAHRNVTVYLPPEAQSKNTADMTEAEKKALEAGAAAAAALAQAEEEEKAKAQAAAKKK